MGNGHCILCLGRRSGRWDPIAGQLILLFEVTYTAGEVYVEYQECKNGGS
jgi:hypothetical protein